MTKEELYTIIDVTVQQLVSSLSPKSKKLFGIQSVCLCIEAGLIAILSHQRDLLLSRLMSGKFEVNV